MTGNTIDRVAYAIDPRAFGPLEGNYLFKSWQAEAQKKAVAQAEAVLRTLRDQPTYAVLSAATKSLEQTDYIEPFDQAKEAYHAALQAAISGA